MLTAEQNDRYSRVGPGTPMGKVMRRYWHPITASAELNEENPTKEIRLLGNLGANAQDFPEVASKNTMDC